MKYLKFFESRTTAEKIMLENADDIVNVLTKYYLNYSDFLCTRIDEIVWNTISCGDEFGQTGELTEDMVRTIIEELKGGWERNINDLLDVYYQCKPMIDLIDENTTEDIRDIFSEYSDYGKFEVFNKSDHDNVRYLITIEMKDIFFKINFQEVFGKLKDLGFDDYKIEGKKNESVENLTIQFSKKLD